MTYAVLLPISCAFDGSMESYTIKRCVYMTSMCKDVRQRTAKCMHRPIDGAERCSKRKR